MGRYSIGESNFLRQRDTYLSCFILQSNSFDGSSTDILGERVEERGKNVPLFLSCGVDQFMLHRVPIGGPRAVLPMGGPWAV